MVHIWNNSSQKANQTAYEKKLKINISIGALKVSKLFLGISEAKHTHRTAPSTGKTWETPKHSSLADLEIRMLDKDFN